MTEWINFSTKVASTLCTVPQPRQEIHIKKVTKNDKPPSPRFLAESHV